MKFTHGKFTTTRFVVTAIILMLAVDMFVFGGKRSYIENARQSYHAEQAAGAGAGRGAHSPDSAPPVRVAPDDGSLFFEDPLTGRPGALPEGGMMPDRPDQEQGAGESPAAPPDDKPDDKAGGQARDRHDPHTPHDTRDKGDEQAQALPPVRAPAPPRDGYARVAIVIDDLGMDVRRSRAVMDLPAPITLAFLPYAGRLAEQTGYGAARGHPLIIHTPMEAVDATQNIGPLGLKAGMDQADFNQSLQKIFQSFDGYGGINNHMGSRLTQDETAMNRLMAHLKARNLYFLDSRTINSSVAARAARAAGVPYAVRDVFLDHESTPSFVANALRQTERIALEKGHAIAIGHPKDATLAGLKAWLPTLKEKGIILVPVQDLLTYPKGAPVMEPGHRVARQGPVAPPRAPEQAPIPAGDGEDTKAASRAGPGTGQGTVQGTERGTAQGAGQETRQGTVRGAGQGTGLAGRKEDDVPPLHQTAFGREVPAASAQAGGREIPVLSPRRAVQRGHDSGTHDSGATAGPQAGKGVASTAAPAHSPRGRAPGTVAPARLGAEGQGGDFPSARRSIFDEAAAEMAESDVSVGARDAGAAPDSQDAQDSHDASGVRDAPDVPDAHDFGDASGASIAPAIAPAAAPTASGALPLRLELPALPEQLPAIY